MLIVMGDCPSCLKKKANHLTDQKVSISLSVAYGQLTVKAVSLFQFDCL